MESSNSILETLNGIFEILDKVTDGNIVIYILIIIIFAILILNFFSRRSILKYIQSIPTVMNAENTQKSIKDLEDKIYQLQIYNQEAISNFENIQSKLKNIVKINTVKYNPYEDMGVGGKQSFSTSMLDEKGDGVILTCLYSREKTRIMTKIVKGFIPEQELTPEEQQVLQGKTSFEDKKEEKVLSDTEGKSL